MTDSDFCWNIKQGRTLAIYTKGTQPYSQIHFYRAISELFILMYAILYRYKILKLNTNINK